MELQTASVKPEETNAYNNYETDVNVVAALSNAHFPVKIDVTYNVLLNKEVVGYHITQWCLENKRSSTMLKAQLKGSARANYDYQPEEWGRFLLSVRCCENEDVLRMLGENPMMTYEYSARTWRLVATKGQPVMANLKGLMVAETHDVKLAAALITVGYPLLAVVPVADGVKFTIGNESVLNHIVRPVARVISEFRSELLPDDHNLVHCYYALLHKEEVVKETRRAGRNILYQAADVASKDLSASSGLGGKKVTRRNARGGGVSATVTENAALGMIKRAERHIL